MGTKSYDLIVIGSGSGLDVAVGAAEHLEWEVALIEKGPLGGTCLNRGCIPSKMIIHAADVAETIRRAGEFGIDARLAGIDFSAVTGRATRHVDEESARIEKSLREQSVIGFYKGTAAFVSPMTLEVNGQQLKGERILIAAGARPFIPAIPGLDQVEYWTSTEALRQTSQPRSLIILGGGFISAELGHFYGALGTEVTIVQRSGRLLAREDHEISENFTKLFGSRYRVLLNHSVEMVRQKPDSSKEVVVKDAEGRRQTLAADALLVAMGLQPNTDLLHLETTAVQTDRRGFIQANEYLETTAENIWALGDIIGKAPFKHAANEEARRLFWNLSGEHRHPMDYTVMPRAIFTSPQIAAVGLTEQEAQAAGIEYQVARLAYQDTGMGVALGETDGFVKFLLGEGGSKILGCHIMGPDASTLIHEVVVVMTAMDGNRAGITVPIHIHPALSEVIQRAL